MATKSETLFAKKILLCGNLIFAIGGLMYLLAFAIIKNKFSITTYAALGIFGPLLIILTYLGLFSRLKNDNFMTVIFSACLLIIFIAEMSIADMPTKSLDSENSEKSADKNTDRKFILKIKEKYKTYINSKSFKLDIHKFQKEKECCGWKGPEDWYDFSIPSSCCANNKTKSVSSVVCHRSSHNLHRVGCFEKIPVPENKKHKRLDIKITRNNRNKNSTRRVNTKPLYTDTFIDSRLSDVVPIDREKDETHNESPTIDYYATHNESTTENYYATHNESTTEDYYATQNQSNFTTEDYFYDNYEEYDNLNNTNTTWVYDEESQTVADDTAGNDAESDSSSRGGGGGSYGSYRLPMIASLLG